MTDAAEHPTYEKVRDLVADSLACDQGAVRLDARLVTDLGADSLDFIDMIFALEKAFGVKLRQGELDFLSRVVSNPEVARESTLPPDAVEALSPWLPALRQLPDPTKVTPAQVFSLITVETLCIMVERALAEARQ